MLNQYIQAHGRRLYGLCMTLCRDTQDAEDLYQDMWLKIMVNLEKYNANMPFEPWAAQVCVNLYRSRLRRLTRSPIFNGFLSTEDKDTAIENVAAKEQEDYSDLHAAIDQLPEKLRLVIVLFYFEDMDIRSVAGVLQIPEGTVKSRLNKARKLLKEEL